MSVNLAAGKKANLREIGNLDCISYTRENLALSRLSGFDILGRVLSEYENCEDVFFNQSRYMNTTFRYNFLHVRLQMIAAPYNPAFDGGGPHCKTEYILLHTFGSVILKCIPVDMLLPF